MERIKMVGRVAGREDDWTMKETRRAVVRRAAGVVLGLGRAEGKSVERVEVSGGVLTVEFGDGAEALPRGEILKWVKNCAVAVSRYMGRFPVRRARVDVEAWERGRGVGHGTSWGEGGALCRVAVGAGTTEEEFRQDWVLTHEMFHFAFPSVEEEHHWIEEGISTYVEPIARAAVGLIEVEQVWSDMMRDMPKGLPRDGDRGLDVTHTWGRTYWGGALYCLLADVGIRKATGNRAGLREALRGINGAGGNITVDWPLERALEIGDRATGTRVMSELYGKMARAAYAVDLGAIWEELGVKRRGEGVEFVESAPMEGVRRAMIAGGAGVDMLKP